VGRKLSGSSSTRRPRLINAKICYFKSPWHLPGEINRIFCEFQMSIPPLKPSHRWSSLAKPALATILASGFIGLTAGDAQALVVNVGAQDYDVTNI